MSAPEAPLHPCPCCGRPALSEPAAHEICPHCGWEDDGQSDRDAHVVRGGPNGDYSLREARQNQRAHGSMYRPGDPSSPDRSSAQG